MKKTFTLTAFVLAALSVCAQTESWTVYDENGLKPLYVANSEQGEMSVVEFSTDHVKGIHTSGPISSYPEAELVDGKLVPDYNNSWSGLKTQALSSDNSVAPFKWVQGYGNPVNIDKVAFVERETGGIPMGKFYAVWDDAYYSPDGANGLPTNGTYITFTPSVDGTMKISAWVNKGYREIFIVKESGMKALSFGTDIKISGYITDQNNDVEEGSPLYGYMKYQDPLPMKGTEGNDPYIIEGTKDFTAFVYLTFNVTADETYFVFNKSTQIGFSGYEFTPSGGTGIKDITASGQDDDNAPIYNLAGQRVNKDRKGILIQNGKKFINK